MARSRLSLFLLAACSPPDGSALYSPFSSAGTAPMAMSGAGGNGGAPSPGAGGVGGAGAGEGVGGSELGLAGTNGAAGSGGPDAGATDAGEDAAASAPDAAPPCSPGPERCDGIDNDCDGVADPGDTCAASCTGLALAQRGYMFCSDAVTRAQALTRCAAEGLRLAWLETGAENDALRAQIVATGVTAPGGNATLLTQIGGSDAVTEGSWFWVGNAVAADGFQFWQGQAEEDDGQAVGGAFESWADGEPSASQVNEDCAAMTVLGSATRAPGEWDDRGCNDSLPFVCEAP